MEELAEVETAKALMTEAMAWSVMKWLREKKRVRKTADEANAALDQLSAAVKQCWSEDVRAAYEALLPQAAGTRSRNSKKPPSAITPEATLIAQKIKQADDDAYGARMDAEATFDEAERQLSTSLAREGCRKALHGWDLHEKAIRKAESVVDAK
ncbi:MAG TPA: hypothetical protein VJ999_01590 [Candidatus Sulfotelmatobacter sp.]|nr:hypothetical protein [Candidatus Sulfotelmatobacter sp.]